MIKKSIYRYIVAVCVETEGVAIYGFPTTQHRGTFIDHLRKLQENFVIFFDTYDFVNGDVEDD